MKTFIIDTLGCKVNQYEGQQIRQLLHEHGLEPATAPDKAELVIINTCCVTHNASAKSRQYIRKAQKNNPNAVIIVCGCLPVGQSGELKNISKNVHIVRQKKDLANAVVNVLTPNYDSSSKNSLTNKQLKPLKSYPGKCRAFLKIQDGCDGYCTYCIVPKIRPTFYNKPATTVLQEVYDLIYAGHKEIVLTGIFLGAYGQSTVRRSHWDPTKKDALACLVEKVAQVPNLKRLRLSSLEPADLTDKLLNVLGKYPNIMPHLHLPLQSGSERILRKMARQYTAKDFLQVVEKAKLMLDRPAITTDIIVGFPGETDNDFEQTVEVAKAVGFAKMHVFSFSPRKGTPAAKIQPQVKPEVIKARSRRLRKLDRRLQEKFRSQFAGEKVGVIVEQLNPLRGRSERYFMVELNEKKEHQWGSYIEVVSS
ncbi:MAG: tRNA (N(6)-L-threonylcarbamoyladenosine(37)-C(2))-methylthiotransferase MtaB [Planctomycetota bacterium]|jgi:threonylcarbamoyladenosine tRNA methylthiotransferase MtaB